MQKISKNILNIFWLCRTKSKFSVSIVIGIILFFIKRLNNFYFTFKVELSVKGNPMWRDETKSSESTDRIRDLLPSLKILNGVILPKRISFDDETASVPLPEIVKKLTTNDHAVNELVLHFLREYFEIYDSDNRWITGSLYLSGRGS